MRAREAAPTPAGRATRPRCSTPRRPAAHSPQTRSRVFRTLTAQMLQLSLQAAQNSTPCSSDTPAGPLQIHPARHLSGWRRQRRKSQAVIQWLYMAAGAASRLPSSPVRFPDTEALSTSILSGTVSARHVHAWRPGRKESWQTARIGFTHSLALPPIANALFVKSSAPQNSHTATSTADRTSREQPHLLLVPGGVLEAAVSSLDPCGTPTNLLLPAISAAAAKPHHPHRIRPTRPAAAPLPLLPPRRRRHGAPSRPRPPPASPAGRLGLCQPGDGVYGEQHPPGARWAVW